MDEKSKLWNELLEELEKLKRARKTWEPKFREEMDQKLREEENLLAKLQEFEIQVRTTEEEEKLTQELGEKSKQLKELQEEQEQLTEETRVQEFTEENKLAQELKEQGERRYEESLEQSSMQELEDLGIQVAFVPTIHETALEQRAVPLKSSTFVQVELRVASLAPGPVTATPIPTPVEVEGATATVQPLTETVLGKTRTPAFRSRPLVFRLITQERVTDTCVPEPKREPTRTITVLKRQWWLIPQINDGDDNVGHRLGSDDEEEDKTGKEKKRPFQHHFDKLVKKQNIADGVIQMVFRQSWRWSHDIRDKFASRHFRDRTANEFVFELVLVIKIFIRDKKLEKKKTTFSKS